MQVCNPGVETPEDPQQPVDSFGMAQFSSIKELHRPCRRLVGEGEQPIIETGADNRYLLPIHRIQSGYLFRLVFAQRQNTVNPAAIFQDPVTEVRTLDKLPQFGRVAGGNHRHFRQDTPRNCAHQPEVMTVDDIDGKCLGNPPDFLCKHLFIPRYRLRRQIAEAGTGVGHDIAHPGNGKIEIAFRETDETAALCPDSIESGRHPG